MRLPSFYTNHRDIIIRIANVIGFVVVVIFNVLASSSTAFDGKSTSQISDKFFNKFTPAGYAFSIWGLIYFAVAAFLIYQFFPQKRHCHFITDRIGWLFFLTCVLNSSWILAWGYSQIWVSAVLIVLFLLTLLTMHYRLEINYGSIGRGRVAKGTDQKLTAADWWLIQIPWSLYTGWLSVATVACISAAFVSTGQIELGWTASGWCATLVTITTVLSAMMLYRCNDFIYASVIVWAVSAITKSAQSLPDQDPVVITATIVNASLSGVGVFVCLVSIIVVYFQQRFGWGPSDAHSEFGKSPSSQSLKSGMP